MALASKLYRVEYTRDGEQTSVEIETSYGPGYAVDEVYARHKADDVTDVVEL